MFYQLALQKIIAQLRGMILFLTMVISTEAFRILQTDWGTGIYNNLPKHIVIFPGVAQFWMYWIYHKHLEQFEY